MRYSYCSSPSVSILSAVIIHIVIAISYIDIPSVFAFTSSFVVSQQHQRTHCSTSPCLTQRNAIAIPRQQQQRQQGYESIATDVDLRSSQQRHHKSKNVPPTEQWVVDLDYDNFGKDVAALGKELQRMGGTEDVQHMNKIVSWRNICAIVGLSTVWMTPNPITIAALSTWTYASWTMIAHHTCHGGYNRFTTTTTTTSSGTAAAASVYSSRGYALGSVLQRGRDWLDWMLPEAWNVEHNRLHHYRLNEMHDPDLVQRNLQNVRESTVPILFKYMAIAFVFPIWKWFYYAPNTFKELQINQWKQEGKELPKDFDPNESVTLFTLLSFKKSKYGRALRNVVKPIDFITQVIGPFLLTRFVLIPLPLLLIPNIGSTLWNHAMWNVVLAEIFTNIHSYITIVTNHAGEDLYTFDDAVKPRSSSFYVRQIVGSANYITNYDDITDFCHGFLNYQIEHHVWPDLSMRQYQIGAPKLEAICHQYGVPYVRESVWKRLQKTMDIMVGTSTMRTFPTQYEPLRDKATTVTWKTTNGAIDDE